MVSFKVKINETTHDLNDIDGTNFIIDAKSKVENITGVPKSNQKWVYKGRILPDQMTITEANIIDGNTVIVMRTAQPQPVAADTPSKSPLPSPSQGNSVSPMNAANVPSFMGNVPSTARFDTAMRDLLNQNTDETVVKTTVSLLLKVISNIISNPLDAKYRRLNRTNAAFSKKVGSVTGGNNCMIALGFQIEGEEWVLTPNA
jgi:ubiquilin